MNAIAKLINIKWHPFCNIEFQLPKTDQIIYMAIQCSNRDKRLSRGSERLWQGFMDVNDVRSSP